MYGKVTGYSMVSKGGVRARPSVSLTPYHPTTPRVFMPTYTCVLASLRLVTVQTVSGAFCLVAGVVGLWAVFLRSRRAAKIFMLTWPAKFVLAVVGTIQFQRLYNEYGVETRFQGIIWLITIFFLLYYFKVGLLALRHGVHTVPVVTMTTLH